MGLGSSSDSIISNQQLLDKLSFVLSEQTPHYGELLVYRLTQKPYDYYLRYDLDHQDIEKSTSKTPRISPTSSKPSNSTRLSRGSVT